MIIFSIYLFRNCYCWSHLYFHSYLVVWKIYCLFLNCCYCSHLVFRSHFTIPYCLVSLIVFSQVNLHVDHLNQTMMLHLDGCLFGNLVFVNHHEWWIYFKVKHCFQNHLSINHYFVSYLERKIIMVTMGVSSVELIIASSYVKLVVAV